MFGAAAITLPDLSLLTVSQSLAMIEAKQKLVKSKLIIFLLNWPCQIGLPLSPSC